MIITDAIDLIKDEVSEEMKKRPCGSVEVQINFNQGGIRDVHITPKRIFTAPKPKKQ